MLKSPVYSGNIYTNMFFKGKSRFFKSRSIFPPPGGLLATPRPEKNGCTRVLWNRTGGFVRLKRRHYQTLFPSGLWHIDRFTGS